MATFDYIIVGAGAAGCVLANRLSEDSGVSVLLLEAGGKTDSLFINMPAGNGNVFGNPRFDWGYQSIDQPTLDGRRIYSARGRGLGGSTIMNGMIYTRGVPADYDHWCSLGLSDWSYSDLLPYFRKSENSWRGPSHYHGNDGPLYVRQSVNYTEIDQLFIQACRQAGYPDNSDFNAETPLGAGRLDVMVSPRGRRMSAYSAYLEPAMNRSNLTVATGVHVRSLVMENRAVSGVECIRENSTFRYFAKREVILCMGAYGTPQCLLLSGIGPGTHLQKMGIPAVHDLSGVGRHLQDHVNVPVQFHCTRPALSFAKRQRIDIALWIGARYLLTGTGPAASPFWGAAGFKSLGADFFPDLEFYFTPMVITEDLNSEIDDQTPMLEKLGAKLFARGKRAISGFQFDMNLLRPTSHGNVTLASPDARDQPHVDFNYLADSGEMATAVAAVKEARRIASQPALQAINGGEISPGKHVCSDTELLDAIKLVANTGQHPVSTCRMGVDPDAGDVVDGHCRVFGVGRLRIVDASIFPRQICGNPTAPIMAMAEKAADLILGRTSA